MFQTMTFQKYEGSAVEGVVRFHPGSDHSKVLGWAEISHNRNGVVIIDSAKLSNDQRRAVLNFAATGKMEVLD